MKNKIKYIISPIMILSLAFVFMPIINIGNWKVSMKDLAQITFAKIDEPYILQQIQSYMQEYVKPYVYLGMILVVLTIFVAVMVLVFKSNVSYIIGMIGEAAMTAIMIMLYVAVNSGIDTIKTMVSYFGMGNVVKVNSSLCYILDSYADCIYHSLHCWNCSKRHDGREKKSANDFQTHSDDQR